MSHSKQSPSPSGSGGSLRQKRHLLLLTGNTLVHGGLHVFRRRPSSHTSSSKSASKPSSSVWSKLAISSPSGAGESHGRSSSCGDCGGSKTGSSTRSCASSTLMLALQSAVLPPSPPRFCSGEGKRDRCVPPLRCLLALKAAERFGRFAGGSLTCDEPGADKDEAMAEEGAAMAEEGAAMAEEGAAPAASEITVAAAVLLFLLSLQACRLFLSRPFSPRTLDALSLFGPCNSAVAGCRRATPKRYLLHST